MFTGYGSPDVLILKEILKPVPNANEVLIKINATAVNSGDCRIRRADPFAVRFVFGLTKPRVKVLGGVFSGTIEAVGAGVTRYKPGDEVFGSCALKYGFGAYAEYKCLPEDGLFVLKPSAISHEEAATIPFGGMTAFHFVKKANIKPGQEVLVYGASGSVGVSVIQLAKFYGARVTGVCSSSNMAMVSALGAEEVIDYTKENFTTGDKKYDFVFDTVNKLKINDALKCLKPKGVLVLVSAGGAEFVSAGFKSAFGKHKIISGVIKESRESLLFLSQLIEGKKLKAVIDKTFPLERLPEAHAYVDKGHKRGNVCIEVSA